MNAKQEEIIRVIPHDISAEQSLLGALMLTGIERSAERFDEIVEVLEPSDFYRFEHETIYSVMLDLNRRNVPVEVITVRDALNKLGKIDSVGGLEYLFHLGEVTPTTANAVHYAQIVAEKAQARRIIEATATVGNLAYSDELPAKDLVERAESEIAKATSRTRQSTEGKGWVSMAKATNALWESVDIRFHSKSGGVTGIPSGLVDLDGITGGFKPGELTILAARPSMGKTALLGTMSQNMGMSGNANAIQSCEMPVEGLVTRMAASASNVNSLYYQNGTLNSDEWDRFARAKEQMHDLPIFIDDTSDISVSQIRARFKRLHSQQGSVPVLYVDYLGLLRCESGMERSERREQVAESARALKNLAKEMRIHVVCLAQLSRKCEMREDKRPMLSDLADSGAIEAHADLVIFLYRDSYYARKSEGIKPAGNVDPVEAIIAKHRNGPVGMVKLGFQDTYCRFVNLTEDQF